MIVKEIDLKALYPFLEDSRLNVYLQDNLSEMNRQDQRRRTMLILPGGGYGMCSTREGEPIAFPFIEQGMNCFVLWYPVAPHRFPSQMLAVAAAMDQIMTHAEEWHIDTKQVAICGFSAGGHLAAHYSTAYDCPEVRAYFPESYAPTHSVLCYPVISAVPGVTHSGSMQNLLGHTPDEMECERFSCDKLVSKQTPPAFIWSTAEDSAVPPENSLLYAAALAMHQIPYELHVFGYGYHGLATADDQTNPPLPARLSRNKQWFRLVGEWMDGLMNT